METIRLDLRALTPDQQVDRLKDQYRLLRGQAAVVRGLVGSLPVRQYISMLKRGYRVSLEKQEDDFVLVLRPDGSTPRLGFRGASRDADERLQPQSGTARDLRADGDGGA